MSTATGRRAPLWRRLAAAVAIAATAPALLAPAAGASTPTRPDQESGEAAITRLGTRLGAVAEAHGLSAAELTEHLRTDPSLRVDARDGLLYVDRVAPAGRAGTATGSGVTTFDPTIATFEDDRGAYDQMDAAGFIRLNALRMRIAANLKRKRR